jgi:hypothetical protein
MGIVHGAETEIGANHVAAVKVRKGAAPRLPRTSLAVLGW